MRAVRVPFSPARPSRLKKLPGILPAAYIRSSTSTVSGRKSTSRRFPAVAVPRTIVSPARTTTAPLACLASFPVSNVISVPPISTETRCACALTSFMLFLSAPPPVGGMCLMALRKSLAEVSNGPVPARALIRADEGVLRVCVHAAVRDHDLLHRGLRGVRDRRFVAVGLRHGG